jgi:hypothetical protein
MTVIIEGTIIKGCGVANKNIKFQMPHLVWQFPDIKDIYPGSINVSLEKPLRILTYDVRSFVLTGAPYPFEVSTSERRPTAPVPIACP